MSYAGKILRVDLSTGKIETEPTSKYAKEYIGGPAIGAKLISDSVAPEVKGRDPENMLTINTGPLTGTLMGNKCDVTTKSPKLLNSPIVTAGMGGQFPSELKFAGYDHLAVTGRADKPVYLFIDNEDVQIRDASHLWGFNTQETQTMIKKELKDPDFQVACIGQAGENQVVSATIIHEIKHCASEGGVGAVMGSKNLKAVAVRGTNGLKIADPESFKKVFHKNWLRINPGGTAYAYAHTMHVESISRHADLYAEKELMQWGYGPDAKFGLPRKMEKHERLEEFDEKYRVGSIGCAFCPVQCHANYAGPDIEGGACNCFLYANNRYQVKNLDTKVWWKATVWAQRYGIESLETTSQAAWLMDLYEKGIITAADTDGIPMEYGSEEAIMAFLHKVSNQEGFGKLFVDGIVPAAQQIANGEGYHHVMMERNMSLPLVLPERGVILGGAGGLNMMETANQLWWYTPVFDRHAMDMFGRFWGIPEEDVVEYCEKLISDWLEEKTGFKDGWRPEAVEGKAEHYKAAEDAISAFDMAGTCDAITVRAPHAGGIMDVEDMANALTAALGENWSVERVEEVCHRKRILETVYNTLCREVNDETVEISSATLQAMMEPVKNGHFKGQEYDMEKSEQVGENYCILRGCDPDTGIPTIETMENLGLKDLADKLFEVLDEE